jgi:DASS family divalent anion:Na+ symporter
MVSHSLFLFSCYFCLLLIYGYGFFFKINKGHDGYVTYCNFRSFRDAIGVSSVVAAMLGLSILLLLGVLDWGDILNEKSAWDTLAWFSVLVGLAAQLTNLGIVSWMSGCIANLLQSWSLSWPAAFGVLQASYFLIHYLFASQTGHIGALYSAFLAMHMAAGVPSVLAALALGFNTDLFGGITHYSSGQAAVYFGGNFISLIKLLF